MNVLSINKFFWRKGGSETVFFNEMELLEEKGHVVIPFSMHGKNNLASDYAPYFVDEVDYESSRLTDRILNATKIIYSLDAKRKISRLLGKYEVDIAHFHIFQHQISPSVFGPVRSYDIPIVLTLHDLKPICPTYTLYTNGHICEECVGGKFYRCMANRCTKNSLMGSLVNTFEMYLHYALGYYQNVDRYIAVSKFYRSKMLDAGFKDNQIEYLPNYIDINEYYSVQESDGYILYFGRLSEEKGLMTLLQSAQINKHINHIIVGTGPLEKSLKDFAQAHEMKNIFFLGFMQNQELKQVISRALAVVVPSEWYENCPMAILESMASGVPVIGSNIGGIPELIEDGVDGYLFESASITDLADKIEAICANPSRARHLGMNGREKINSKFSRDEHYDRLISLYRSVI